MTPKRLSAIMALWFCLMIAAGAQAAVVGRFTAVDGPVDILKQGKVPATAARVNDGVEPGDVIRTKAKAKAQLKFMDDSQVTLAPESRMAVADYTYDADKGERRAVLRFFKGVMHTVVTGLLKVQAPNFLMQTHTATLGVRGTETYTVLLPNATGAYLIDGLLEVSSNNPQILGGQLLQRHGVQHDPAGPTTHDAPAYQSGHAGDVEKPDEYRPEGNRLSGRRGCTQRARRCCNFPQCWVLPGRID